MNSMPSVEILNATMINAVHKAPLHQQVHSLLHGAIEEHFEDGQAFWTEKLLIEKLGVSRITVRHALAELTREGLLVREALRGTTVRKQGVTSLGIVFDKTESDFVGELIQRCAAQCLARGWNLELYPLWGHISPQQLITKIRHAPAQERLLLFTGSDSRELSELLKARDYQILSLDELGEKSDLASVVTDSAAAVRLAVTHLVGLGHRRIAFLVNEPEERPSVQRKVAECQRLFDELGWDEARVVHCQEGNNSFDKVTRAMPALWEGELRPTAIFTASDPGAWAALRWFAERRIEVPGEVSVLGFEGVTPDAFTYPPLSTVAHDLDELARRAVEALWQDAKSQPPQQFVAPRLILRQSTGLCCR